ncbi:MAG: AIPR family protein [Woeseiaceae bacterium]|nr:AIPR family protein [Woeseiaceae bacterium]
MGRFVSSIIIGTNKQNEVKEEQFWALRPFMKDLEEYCKQQNADEKIFLERRENQYRDESVERTRIVKPSDLLKCVVAMYLYFPNRAARDWRGIRRDFEDNIFQAEHGVEPYHLACLGSYKFLDLWSEIDESKNLGRFIVSLFTRWGSKLVGGRH